MRGILVTAALATAMVTTAGQADSLDDIPSCHSHPQLAMLDFWLGEWRVIVAGETAGHNRIERVLDGCAVVEHWRSRRGGRGMSLFYLAPNRRELRQVWVTSAGLGPGGTKEKSFITRTEDGTLVFEGVWWTGAGEEMLDRTRLTPLPDGRVRQVIDVSADAGKSWTSNFDAVYVRVNQGQTEQEP